MSHFNGLGMMGLSVTVMEQLMTFVESDYNKLEEDVLSAMEQNLKAIGLTLLGLLCHHFQHF